MKAASFASRWGIPISKPNCSIPSAPKSRGRRPKKSARFNRKSPLPMKFFWDCVRDMHACEVADQKRLIAEAERDIADAERQSKIAMENARAARERRERIEKEIR